MMKAFLAALVLNQKMNLKSSAIPKPILMKTKTYLKANLKSKLKVNPNLDQNPSMIIFHIQHHIPNLHTFDQSELFL